MDWACMKCGEKQESDFSWDADVSCCKCGAVHETYYNEFWGEEFEQKISKLKAAEPV